VADAPAARAGGSQCTLEFDVRRVLLDQELLDRVARSIQLQRGGSYAAGLDVLYRGVDAPSLRCALERAQIDADSVEAGVELLAALDAAARGAQARLARRVARELVDGAGRVRLEGSAEVALRPEQREHRLTRARQAAPGQFEGEDGRRRFLELDRHHLCAGLDMVRTLERPADIRWLRAQPAALAAQLVQQIAAAGESRQKLAQLEAKVAELRGSVVDLERARTASARRRSAPRRSSTRKPAHSQAA
jgi:hypothetical protein